MRNKQVMLAVTIALLAASWACGLPGRRATDTPSSPTPTPVPASRAWEEIPPPPPAGLVDALQAQVDAEVMTPEQAIVSGLQIVAGEVDPAATLDEAPTSFEGSGVVFDAQRYLLFGTDEATKAEIARLLPVLAPQPEILLPFSVQEGAAHPRVGGLARPAAQQSCADLYAKGFPPGSSGECFVVRKTQIGPSTIQIFLPSAEQPEGYDPDFADAAQQAVADSLAAYSQLQIPGRTLVLKDIQVVFSLLDSAGGTTLATVPTDPGQNPCQIILFPLAMAVSQADDPTGFQQTVAHEVFHCFQIWNFPALAQNALWSVQDWWGESTATYFSNVVYPGANEEWGWIEDWSYNSGASPLVYNSYDNFGFFQYLANRIGNDGVLELIQTLEPAAQDDEASQEALLAEYPGIEDLFAEYAVAFMDGTIVDASGATIPTAPAFVLPMYRIDAPDDALIPFGASPFTITRYGVTFGSRQTYDLQPMVVDLSGYTGLRPINDVGQWVHLPTQVQGACTPRRYYVLMANAVPSSGDLGFGLTVTAGEPLDCGFTPTPPLPESSPEGPQATVAYCPFGSLEGSTSFGYGCQDGGFRAFIDNDEQPYEFITGSTGDSYEDVVIEVDVRLIQGEDFSGAFVLCRDQYQENFYYFKLFHDGVAIGEYNDGDEQIVRMGPLPPGTDPLATNRLRAECIGSRLALYVNGVLALERDDDTVTHGGVGLGAGEGENGFTEVFFENWEINQP
jgi:hypothetical protein